jgi:hypothetical protein
MYTSNHWHKAQINGYHYTAKIYSEGSEYGIDGGPVSKLHIEDPEGQTICSYDRGWDIKPEFGSTYIAFLEGMQWANEISARMYGEENPDC